MSPENVSGVCLRRTVEGTAGIEALARVTGGRVGLDGVLGDLNRRARRSFLVGGRAVHRSYRWEATDCQNPRWWPQGVTSSADASGADEVQGRRLLVTTWYSKELAGVHKGARLTFLDLDSLRYRHVLLVAPVVDEGGRLRVEPVRIHAGGLVWAGSHLHVAATARGFVSGRVEDILRVPDEAAAPSARLRLGVEGSRFASMGYRYVLPVRFAFRAFAEREQEKMRFSFMSLDRSTDPPGLVVGEYGRGQQTTRVARFSLDPDGLLPATDHEGRARPTLLEDSGVPQMQGIVEARGLCYATASNGPRGLGSVYVGRPGSFRRFRHATPIGCEDLTWWPSSDLLWSVTEHPRRRWVFSMRRSWFD